MATTDDQKKTQRKAAADKAAPTRPGAGTPAEPFVLQLTDAAAGAGAEVKVSSVANPLLQATLGELGPASSVTGPPQFPPTILVQPFSAQQLRGLDPTSVRVFSVDKSGLARPVWNSGINLSHHFTWAMVTQPGTYVPIGLPRDRLLQEVLRTIAVQRRYADSDSADAMKSITDAGLKLFGEGADADLEELRHTLARAEVHSRLGAVPESEIKRGRGAAVLAFPLPGDATLQEFRDRLGKLTPSPSGLPEEALFFRPESFCSGGPPWPMLPAEPHSWEGLDPRVIQRLGILDKISLFPFPFPFPICWIFSQNWWMYHHDERHTGQASGCSGLTSTTVGCLKTHPIVTLDGSIITIPTIVQGKIYVGTGNSSTAKPSGGTMYRIDLVTGAIEKKFTFNTPLGSGSNQGYAGVGSSPAVVGGRVYFSGLDGKVYCLDANTFGVIWTTDLRHADAAHNQPVKHTVNAEGWSSPLVVNGRVYVGCGEGESQTFGFVYCLDANTGNVVWLFCTNQFTTGVDNNPNVIPNSAVGITPLPAPFTSHADPPQKGASPWSSCAYDRSLNRVYIGTGNPDPDTPLPDVKYSSGCLALDASTGQFRGFFQPDKTDSYRADDDDVDVPSGPTLFTRAGTHVVGIGSKNGAYFLLDASTMAPLASGRRQLLPKDAVTGNPLPNVDPHVGPGENFYGIFGTAAVHAGLGRLFVGLGGYGGAIDTPSTPFMRALDWNNLNDAWATAVQTVGGNKVSRYTVPNPPMYTTPNESGIGSPAVVNDVVFVSTSKPGLYALSAATGLFLWAAPDLGPASIGTYVMGPAIYGNYVVIGANNGTLHIYSV
jgi:outer membrane protein assembly factor BamB